MTDVQLRQAITQLSTAAGLRPQPPQNPATAVPAQVHPAYMNNIRHWSNSVTPPPANGRTNPSRKTRAAKGSSLAATPQPSTSAYPPTIQTNIPRVATPNAMGMPAALAQDPRAYPPRSALPTNPQALRTSYASRLRTGATLLMQPVLSAPTAVAVATRSTRRGGFINYAEPGSGDEFPDAGAIDSDDSDFIAGGGVKTMVRTTARLPSKAPVGAGVFSAGGVTHIVQAAPQTPMPAQRTSLDQSYLGRIPPERFIAAKSAQSTSLPYFTPDSLEVQARKPVALIPIRVEFETDAHRIRDCFVWNLHEDLIPPEVFARTFVQDLDLPEHPWVELVANQIRAQLEEHEGVGSMDFDVANPFGPGEDEVPECRVILSIDVQIATYHLLDHIEWDLLSPLTPEQFASQLCADLGLAGEAVPLVAHAIHEELIKHKRDAIEWGIVGVDPHPSAHDDPDRPRDRSGLSLLKDKTGLGLGWGRTPKDGRGPKSLRSVWRDWAETEEFKTRFEVLTPEEVERREVEKERASRRLRRETSKFQGSRRRR
ncbi:uncharacterized protein PHACADRAFT_261963 [Phanerochaete carnosa HHB-10118-sp]|uniref:SNF5-domain-containing protein n=1 Tax=Phanerochaete carnosa (strain HHB-10118-sp) TaxID=650164 RepID=K5VJY3_PHACS|nr:uncharacterized protein PHACADRAFT_261963 [Phanerochaete carnosa HHB-10118-sp]EKM51678.1 hypothetical protein PHACADRAFT_261963 [Phanerochaete carnosa HHB-10118-sp]